ncbi:2-dehydro-3-deoxygluconokinase [compost metagenome]
MWDVVGLGEVLIDFTPAGWSDNGNVLFERNPGGAPANVLTALSRLGRKTAFIGKVGQDQFGRFLADCLGQNGIETSGVVFSSDTSTTLAFVHLNEEGERSFSFYRNPGADTELMSSEVNPEMLRNARIFHFGSISMTHEPAATATLEACRQAREYGALISFDPNLRPALWTDERSAKEAIAKGLGYADIVKLSFEEMQFLTSANELEEGAARLHEQYGTPVILVTLGERGCYFHSSDYSAFVPAYKVHTVDTTGAGDAFLGGFLNKLLEKGGRLASLSEEDYVEMVRYGNAVGALATTKKGAIPAMPSQEEICEFMNEELSRYVE